MGYFAMVMYSKSDAGKEWFKLIASRSIGTKVAVERLSLSFPGLLIAHNVKSKHWHLKTLSINLNPLELLGPTQTAEGTGELVEGLAFFYRFRGSVWTQELRSLTVKLGQWPLAATLKKVGVMKYLLAPPEQGSLNGVLFKRKEGWEFQGSVKGAVVNLQRIATGSQFPRAFPERSRANVGPVHLRYTPRQIKFVKPLQLKTRMGSLRLEGILNKKRNWQWQANAYVKDAKVARAGYGYLLRCRPLPEKNVFKVRGPVQGPVCR